MRWSIYFAIFLAIIFCSFWSYVWIYRLEFTQTTIERSCPPYKITIDTVEITDFQTATVQNLSILTKETSPKLLVRISKATLTSPTTSWLFWLLTPSRSPLHLTSVTLTIPQGSHLSFEQPSLHLLLNIDTLTIEGSEGQIKTLHHIQGPVATVLSAATE